MLNRTFFGEVHELFPEQVRRFLEEEVISHHGDWKTNGIVPRAIWRKAGGSGYSPLQSTVLIKMYCELTPAISQHPQK